MINPSKYFDSNRLELVLKKGIFPNEWFVKLRKLGETKLPLPSEFYSKLKCTENN